MGLGHCVRWSWRRGLKYCSNDILGLVVFY
jgi:hypothetical protein